MGASLIISLLLAATMMFLSTDAACEKGGDLTGRPGLQPADQGDNLQGQGRSFDSALQRPLKADSLEGVLGESSTGGLLRPQGKTKELKADVPSKDDVRSLLETLLTNVDDSVEQTVGEFLGVRTDGAWGKTLKEKLNGGKSYLTLPKDVKSKDVGVTSHQNNPDPINDRLRTNVPTSEKRQQGWYSDYGKRQENSVPRRLSRVPATNKRHKRQQGWQSGYGKRHVDDVISNDKRQQGWETGYGKRSGQGFSFLRVLQTIPEHYRDVVVDDVINPDDYVVSNVKNSDDDLIDDVINLANDVISDVVTSDQDVIGYITNEDNPAGDDIASDLSQASEPFMVPSDADMGVAEGEYRLANGLKRQQGWHSPYGKRALRQSYRGPVLTRQQGSHIPQEKVSLSRILKRQQGWHAPYGKRSLKMGLADGGLNGQLRETYSLGQLLKRQQGWHSPYGKRALKQTFGGQALNRQQKLSSLQEKYAKSQTLKRQQGWHSPYGKRSLYGMVGTPEGLLKLFSTDSPAQKWSTQPGWQNPPRGGWVGKRSVAGRQKRQQGWHAPYRKRSLGQGSGGEGTRGEQSTMNFAMIRG